MSEFLHMGGYAAYVWSSYALALIVMLLVFFQPILENKRLIKKLKGKYRREQSEKLAKQEYEQNQQDQNKETQ